MHFLYQYHMIYIEYFLCAKIITNLELLKKELHNHTDMGLSLNHRNSQGNKNSPNSTNFVFMKILHSLKPA